MDTLTRVRSVAFSPDGRLLASASYDHTVSLWSVASGQLLYSLHGHTDHLRAVTFSPDGSLLASCGYDKSIRLWHLPTHTCLKIFSDHTDWVRSVAFNSHGSILTSASRDGTIRCWDIQQGDNVCTMPNERPYEKMDITGVKGLTEAQKLRLKLWEP